MTKRPKSPGEAVGDRDELLEAIGERVREARQTASMTQKQLADLAGMTQAYVYMVEAGGQNITISVLSRLAQALGVSTRDLIPEESEVQSLGRLADALKEFAETSPQYQDEGKRLYEMISLMTQLHQQFSAFLRPPRLGKK